MKINKIIDEYGDFVSILNDAAKIYAEKPFIVWREREYSFREFNTLVNTCAHMLMAEGAQKGDIISIILKNSIDYLILYFAVLRAGCIINPFPFHLGANEIREKLDFINPKFVLAHKALKKGLSQLESKLKIVQSDKENILEQMLDSFSGRENSFPVVDPDETAFMYYSSGTTGTPKIIEYSMKSEILAMGSLLRSGFMGEENCHICMLPLGHTAAIRYSILPCLLTGSRVILFESFWKLRTNLWNVVNKYNVTFFEIVPSILIAILNTSYPNLFETDISSLRFIGCGSAYLAQNLQEKIENKFNVPVANMYGLSETGATHFDNPFDPHRKTGSVGRPLDIMEVGIFTDDGQAVAAGRHGEIGIKGPSLLKNYYKNNEQFRACFRNGYFLTGDIGYVDEHGIFYYVDRKKDLIMKGGVNIVPSQIDAVLLSHDGVKEAATIGVPHMFLGETIKSYVVLKNGDDIETKQLQLFCKERLGEFKTPSEFEFVEELPKGASGKILKRRLREKEFNSCSDIK